MQHLDPDAADVCAGEARVGPLCLQFVDVVEGEGHVSFYIRQQYMNHMRWVWLTLLAAAVLAAASAILYGQRKTEQDQTWSYPLYAALALGTVSVFLYGLRTNRIKTYFGGEDEFKEEVATLTKLKKIISATDNAVSKELICYCALKTIYTNLSANTAAYVLMEMEQMSGVDLTDAKSVFARPINKNNVFKYLCGKISKLLCDVSYTGEPHEERYAFLRTAVTEFYPFNHYRGDGWLFLYAAHAVEDKNILFRMIKSLYEQDFLTKEKEYFPEFVRALESAIDLFRLIPQMHIYHFEDLQSDIILFAIKTVDERYKQYLKDYEQDEDVLPAHVAYQYSRVIKMLTVDVAQLVTKGVAASEAASFEKYMSERRQELKERYDKYSRVNEISIEVSRIIYDPNRYWFDIDQNINDLQRDIELEIPVGNISARYQEYTRYVSELEQILTNVSTIMNELMNIGVMTDNNALKELITNYNYFKETFEARLASTRERGQQAYIPLLPN